MPKCQRIHLRQGLRARQPEQASAQFSGQPTPLWEDRYHGNFTAQHYLGLCLPLEQPAHDRPADWEIWLLESSRLRVFHTRHASSCLSAAWSRCAAQTLVTATYLSLAHGLGPEFLFRGRSNWDVQKALSEPVRQRSHWRGRCKAEEGKRCRYSRRTPLSQSIGSRQGRRETLAHSSAGANMCSRDNLRCNQNLMGERPAAPAASNTETREERRDRRRRRVTQRGVKAALWKRRIFQGCLIGAQLQRWFDLIPHREQSEIRKSLRLLKWSH